MIEMKKDKAELEKNIQTMLREFVDKHGACDIDLSSQLTYEHFPLKNEKVLLSVNVDVVVTI